MLKDFFKNMFSDDDDYEDDDYYDDEEDDEEEEEYFEEEVQPVQPAVTSVPSQPEPLFVEPEIQNKPRQTYIHDPNMKKEEDQTKPEKSSFSGISVDELNPKESKKTQKRSSRQDAGYHFDRNKLPNPKPMRQPESPAYQAVISPIFGNMDETQKEFDKVHNAIDLPKPEDDFAFVQVLSPMYGNDIPKNEPVESIPGMNVSSHNKKHHKHHHSGSHGKGLDLSEMIQKPEEEQPASLFEEKGSDE